MDSILRRLRQTIQSRFTFRSHQEETLFETPYFPHKYIKHLLGLTEGNPVSTPLNVEDREEDVLERGNSQILAHQFKRPHKNARIGMDLRRRQFGPAEHFSLKIGERKFETHVFKNHIIHGKDTVLIRRTHSIGCAREYNLPIFDSTDRTKRDFSRSTQSK